MEGKPSRMQDCRDYIGLVIPPCGDWAVSPGNPVSSPPWEIERMEDKSLMERLSAEIESFIKYIGLTHEETFARTDVVDRFKALIERLCPGTSLEPFSSSVTGLAFPGSDIDIAVTFPPTGYSFLKLTSARINLAELAEKLATTGYASHTESILHASTPLLRITEAKTRVQLDLTASDNHGVTSTKMLQGWLEGEDGVLTKKLVKVLKLFLAIRCLGTTYTGGINSYLLTLLIIVWVRLKMPKVARSSSPKHEAGQGDGTCPVNTGVALKEFLKFYGEEYNYTTNSIRFSPSTGFHYVAKPPSSRFATKNFLLSISDPADTSIDLGAKAYAIKHVQATFRQAYQTLVDLEIQRERDADPGKWRQMEAQGVLGYILGGDYSQLVKKRREMLGLDE